MLYYIYLFISENIQYYHSQNNAEGTDRIKYKIFSRLKFYRVTTLQIGLKFYQISPSISQNLQFVSSPMLPPYGHPFSQTIEV